MRIRVFDSAEQVARSLAADIERTVAAKPSAVLGLPTGQTPVPLYRELVRRHRAGRIDFSRVTTFNLDEFLGLPPRDPRTYCAFMRTHFFDHINIAPSRINFLNGAVRGAREVQKECARYERAIERAGGIDLQVLGLGANGHIGFNEPANALIAWTHATALTPATRRANLSLFHGTMRDVPTEALSMGMATILHARRVVLLATGAAKARRVARMIEGPVTPKLPASFLQLHRRAETWLDRAAAGTLGVAR